MKLTPETTIGDKFRENKHRKIGVPRKNSVMSLPSIEFHLVMLRQRLQSWLQIAVSVTYCPVNLIIEPLWNLKFCKWAKDLNRQFTKEDMQMEHKHMKRFSWKLEILENSHLFHKMTKFISYANICL